MVRIGKLVAVALALAVLAMPAAALVSCWTPEAVSPACPHCAGMKDAPAPVAAQAAPVGTSCCDLSSGKPAPASVLHVPTVIVALAPHTRSPFAAVLPPDRRAGSSDRTTASPPVSAQAVLCTFLI